MKEILIKVSKETRMVDLTKSIIGNDGENLQGKLIFSFIDEFVNGQARLEYEIKGNKNYVVLNKENETYTIPIKNVITKEGQIDMQLVITEGTDEEEIPVFKSNKFYLFCNASINAVDEAPEGYELWIEQANAKLNQVNNLDIDIQDNVVTITKKDGTTKSENVKGDAYVITDEDLDVIETNVKSDIKPILENNLKNAKDYTDNAIVRDFKDISYDSDTATFVFTRHDNTTFTVDLPIEQTVKNGYYDETTKELVLVLVSDQEIRIPATGLIDDYVGVDSATIQCTISADNKITCNIVGGSISKTLLTTELQEEINNKINKSSFVYDEENETLTITI